jgi:hypothetical protein
MMNLEEYINQVKLNKSDPDFQIEDYWYGFKNSMKKFYSDVKIDSSELDKLSGVLNKLKEEKNYIQIQKTIQQTIQNYCVHVMKYSKFDELKHTNILMTNIKRWNRIAPDYSFNKYSSSTMNVYLFEGFYSIKNKINRDVDSLLELFADFDNLNTSTVNTNKLIIESLELGQVKMLEVCIGFFSFDYVLKVINDFYPSLTEKTNKFIKARKLCKLYKSMVLASV